MLRLVRSFARTAVIPLEAEAEVGAKADAMYDNSVSTGKRRKNVRIESDETNDVRNER